MFTGIIKNKAQFVSLKKYKSKYFLTLNSVQRFTNKDIGSSISINGICLTLIKAKSIKNKCQIMFYLSPETLRLSNLRFLKKKENLNIEKSLRFGDEISGHFVQGHVDDCSSISKINVSKNHFQLVIIPHSLKLTNLINLKKNDKVNVEFDIILKYLNR